MVIQFGNVSGSGGPSEIGGSNPPKTAGPFGRFVLKQIKKLIRKLDSGGEKYYVDDGIQNVPGFNHVGSRFTHISAPQERAIITQEPELSILIKKRAFSSLRHQEATGILDEEEKFLLRATAEVFKKKIQEISVYEKISKLGDELERRKRVSTEGIQSAFDALDFLTSSIGGGEGFLTQLQDAGAVENELTQTLGVTTSKTFLANTGGKYKTNTGSALRNAFDFGVGDFSGTFEITLVTDASTGLDLKNGSMGSCSVNLEDPLNLMKISDYDIEEALQKTPFPPELGMLAQLKNEINQIANFATGGDDPEKSISKLKRLSNEIDQEMKVTSVVFNVVNKKVTVTINSATDNKQITRSDASGTIAAIVQSERSKPSSDLSFREGIITKNISEIFIVAESSDIDSTINQEEIEKERQKLLEKTRNRLRLFYLNKHIIQPMDEIHVFIESRTNKKSQTDVVQEISSILNATQALAFGKSSMSDLFKGRVPDSIIESERKVLAPNLTNSEYRRVRDKFKTEFAGAQVFAGLVDKVNDSWSEGSYNLSVTASNNMKWLNVSVINAAPAIHQPQGVLEDPMTAFELEVDPLTGNAVKNTNMLETNRKRLLTNRIVNPRTNRLYKEEDAIGDKGFAGKHVRTKFQHAPGMKYKWKEGIITATNNITPTRPGSAGATSIDDAVEEQGLSTLNDPFAGLDSANVMSILITGIPYNYDTYFRAAQQVGSLSLNSSTGASSGFLNTLTKFVEKTKVANGAFLPQSQSRIGAGRIDELTRTSIQEGADRLVQTRNRLAALLEGLESSVRMGYESGEDRLNKIADAEYELKDRTYSLDDALNIVGAVGSKGGANSSSKFRMIGNTVVMNRSESNDPVAPKKSFFDFTLFDEPSSAKPSGSDTSSIVFKNKNDIARNVDNNFFIVSDEYDKDTDIQAINVQLQGLKSVDLWKSKYESPIGICKKVASTVDFEFFCDSSGNLRFQPPQYNKTPISIMLKMFQLSSGGKKKLYPPFLENLFKTRSSSLARSIALKNLDILEKLVLIGKDGSEGQREILGSVISSETTSFNPLRQWADIKSIMESVRSEKKAAGATGGASTKKSDSLFGPIAQQDVFNSVVSDLAYDQDNPKKAKAFLERLSDSAKSDEKKLESVRKAKSVLTGSGVISDNESERANEIINTRRSAVERNNVLNDLTTLISERDNMLTLLISTQKQQDLFESEGSSVNIDDMLNDPTLSHLIERDDLDILGPGSGQRFIINDENVLSYDFTESDENVFCRWDVLGAQNMLGGGPEIGIDTMFWAGATDFDMWRQYGYRSAGEVNIPFFSDPELQCKPYALFLATRNRKKIITGTITVVGNEYYQLGDVVYVNSKDMLFYVTGVNQKFTYGDSYTTTLQLEYGRIVGEYIPTPLDIIGKNLIQDGSNRNGAVGITGLTDVANSNEEIYINTVDCRGESNEQNVDAAINTVVEAIKTINFHIPNGEINRVVELRAYAFPIGDEDEPAALKRNKDNVAAVERWLRGKLPEPEDDLSKVQRAVGGEDKNAVITTVPFRKVVFRFDDDEFIKAENNNERIVIPNHNSYSIDPMLAAIVEIVIVTKDAPKAAGEQ